MKIVYYLLLIPVMIFSRLPYGLLHFLADVFAWLGYYVIRYRRKVVRTNLQNSFPQATESQIKDYEKRFYRHFCRQLFDSFKLLSFSKKKAASHISFEGLDVLEQLRKEGARVVFLMMGHYGYWDYFTAAPLMINRIGYDLHQIYRPLKSKPVDLLMHKLRERFGAYSIAKEDVGRSVVSLYRRPINNDRSALIVFIADQTPSVKNIHYFTNFLNQPSAFFTGAERMAAKLDIPVVFMDVIREDDTHYKGVLSLLSAHPNDEEPGSITEKYAQLMEQTIRRNPPYWLWSHKRWKHKIENFPDVPRSKSLNEL